MEATSNDEIDIQAFLKGIDERNMEADNVLASRLSFVKEQGNVSNYTIPRLNPRYGRKRGDWMMESQSSTPPPIRRVKQSAPKPAGSAKPKIVAALPVPKPVRVRVRSTTKPESTPQAKAMAMPIRRPELTPKAKIRVCQQPLPAKERAKTPP
ncbi:hypothetical protein PV326_012472, partial [Microctonus aethiopoides]